MDSFIKTVTAQAESPELALWSEFQDELSKLLDIPISLYDINGGLLVASRAQACLCDTVKGRSEGRDLCNQAISKVIAQVVEKGKIYIHKCHTNQYIFAVPALLGDKRSFVIVGGQVYLSGSEEKDFSEGTSALGLAPDEIQRLKSEIKTIPAKSIFTIPNIISNMALPFLKCLSPETTQAASQAIVSAGASQVQSAIAGESLRNFRALEGVYLSLAPLLDREELYEMILAKSSELVDAERGSLMILDNKSNFLSVKAAKGLDKNIIDSLRVRVGEGISGSIALKGIPVMVRDIENEVPPLKNRPIYKTKSFISIPLKLDNRVIGVINVSDKLTGEVFSEQDLHLLQSFANYASIALERGAYYSMSEELKMLSMTDPLTGLFNRRYFHERLFEEMERVKRHGESFTVFMMDIDNFKLTNDRYGHMAGDEILKCVARTIRDAVRSMDVVARYGGEEFAVILPHTGKKGAFVIAERIRRNVGEARVGVGDGFECITISLGVAEYPNDAANIDDLIDKADKAMYLAKKMGKNRVVVHEQ
ncbi:MAG: diguanylate cyclase [Deltaproteobacteria bacterium]